MWYSGTPYNRVVIAIIRSAPSSCAYMQAVYSVATCVYIRTFLCWHRPEFLLAFPLLYGRLIRVCVKFVQKPQL